MIPFRARRTVVSRLDSKSWTDGAKWLQKLKERGVFSCINCSLFLCSSCSFLLLSYFVYLRARRKIVTEAMEDDSFTFPLWGGQWTIDRKNFEGNPKFLFYAVSWARNIIQGCRKDKISKGENEAEPEYVQDANFAENVGASRQDWNDELWVRFHSPCSFPDKFKRGARIVLSLTNPACDGRWAKTMVIGSRTGNVIWCRKPRSLPFDLIDHVWRVDIVPMVSDHDRFMSNLKMFVDSANPSPVLQKLIGYEPKETAAREDLNWCSYAPLSEERIEQVCASAVGRYQLNAVQRRAVRATFVQHLSLIQGPPGTGKTSTAAGMLYANHLAHDRVQVVAPTNAAVDEVLKRLIEAGVTVFRFGPVDSISKESTGILEPVALEAIVDEKILMGKSNKNYKDAKAKFLNKLLQQPCVVGGTLTSYGQGVELDSHFQGFSVIEECGNCAEPSTLGVCTYSRRVAKIGDPQQLPPVSQNAQLARSSLERLINMPGYNPIMLDCQFRMPEQIAEWPGEYFYQGRLQSFKGRSNPAQLPKGFPWAEGSPIVFVDVMA